MKAYTMTQDELTVHYNDAIDAYLTQLRDAGVLQSDVYEELSRYRIVAAPPTFFGRFWAGLFRKGWIEDKTYYHVVKVIAPKVIEQQEK